MKERPASERRSWAGAARAATQDG